MSASEEIGLVWFRRDLRLDDNPCWAAATSERSAVVPLYVVDRRVFDAAGPYRRRQLVADLQALDFDIFTRTGGRLLVRYGDPVAVVPEVAAAFGAGGVYWNADVSPFSRRRDEAVRSALDVPARTWFGSLILPPGSVRNERGELPRVLSIFHAAWLDTPWEPWPEPGRAIVYDDAGDPLPCLDGPPRFLEGAAEAAGRLARFLECVDDYHDGRNSLDGRGSAQLSADLRYGTISPRAVVRAVAGTSPGRLAVLRQLARRDWYAHLLFAQPAMATESLTAAYRGAHWRNSPQHISAWKGGFTGFPIVDAGMRELRLTGWLPNRIRGIVASFLVQSLLVDWRIGERHFRSLLVDADLAQNVGNWQAAAGVGADSAPVRRVFNPVTQGQVCDPDGEYIRRWVPELGLLDLEHIHAPWRAAQPALAEAGVELGRVYPRPIVDLAEAHPAFVAVLKDAAARARGRHPRERVAGLVAAGPLPVRVPAERDEDTGATVFTLADLAGTTAALSGVEVTLDADAHHERRHA